MVDLNQKTISEIVGPEIPSMAVLFLHWCPMCRRPGHEMAQFTHLTGMPSGAHPPPAPLGFGFGLLQCCERAPKNDAISDSPKHITSSTSGVVFRRNGYVLLSHGWCKGG